MSKMPSGRSISVFTLHITVMLVVASLIVEYFLVDHILYPDLQINNTSLDLPLELKVKGAKWRETEIDNIRVIAFCGYTQNSDFHFFDDAFRRISEWLPIWYAGHYIPPENNVISQRIWCEDKIEEYLSSKMKEMQISPTSSTSLEIIYGSQQFFNARSPLNSTLAGQPMEPARWEGGLHTPSLRTHFQRFIKRWDEVAGSKGIRCAQDDSIIHTYRSRQLWKIAQEINCTVIHLPAVLDYANRFLNHRIATEMSPTNESLSSLLSRQLSLEEARESLRKKSNFCILITMTTFQARYSTDALVRHALCRLLTRQYKPCTSVSSWKGKKQYGQNSTVKKGLETTHEAMKGFKFAITMPNHLQDGYIAEKTMNPYFSNSVAITSIPNIGQYVNVGGMITCQIPEEELRKVQMYYRGRFEWMPFNTTPAMWDSGSVINPIKYDPYANNNTGDEPVLEFATLQWAKALKPCIDEIIRVDQDDDVYIEKLTQPYLLNEGKNSIFDGTYLAMSMLQWFTLKNSPVVRNLDDEISSLDGMTEQTLGAGKPRMKMFNDTVDYTSKTKNEIEPHHLAKLSNKAASVLPKVTASNTSAHASRTWGQNLGHKCTFCEGEGFGKFNPYLVVPGTSANTCYSIKLMAADEVNGSDICKILKKEESVCCPLSPP